VLLGASQIDGVVTNFSSEPTIKWTDNRLVKIDTNYR